KGVDSRIAHTAEHAFIGALQRILGQTLRVRKVEHKKDANTAFIVIPQLDIDAIVKAENMVNALVAEGRAVTTHTYPTLEDARKQNPGLRANEERIAGEARVVEIEGHDVTACAMDHALNLKECDFFLVTRLSKSGGEHEVDFVVGQHAKEAAISLSTKMMRVCEELGANPNTVENTARKVRSQGEANLKKLKALSREKLAGIQPVATNNVIIFKGAFAGLADDVLQEFAGEKIESPGAIVVLANAAGDSAYFVFARNEALALDCNKVFREAAGPDGRGGGKPHFVTGVVKADRAAEIIDRIVAGTLRLN
ncbi:MAG: DHHA1 domain-containing protein, partial [Nitrososphaera sp.]|uniref:DHHA1 domain-containing protein n=1 Tax=Nitrososphaera sp. TaxID=1971748 RepID=UPI003D6ED219